MADSTGPVDGVASDNNSCIHMGFIGVKGMRKSKGVRLLMVIAGLWSVQSLALAENQIATEGLKKEAREVIEPFASDLKQTLKATLQKQGPIAATHGFNDG